MSRGRWILALLVPFLVTNAWIFPTVAGRMAAHANAPSFRPLDLTPNYSSNDAYASLASRGAAA